MNTHSHIPQSDKSVHWTDRSFGARLWFASAWQKSADIVDKGFSELGARTSLESSSLGPKIVELRFMKLT